MISILFTIQRKLSGYSTVLPIASTRLYYESIVTILLCIYCCYPVCNLQICNKLFRVKALFKDENWLMKTFEKLVKVHTYLQNRLNDCTLYRYFFTVQGKAIIWISIYMCIYINNFYLTKTTSRCTVAMILQIRIIFLIDIISFFFVKERKMLNFLFYFYILSYIWSNQHIFI